MKRETLNGYLGQKVRIIFFDDTQAEGILEYISDLCAAQGWRKPGYYAIGNLCFKVSHIKKLNVISQI